MDATSLEMLDKSEPPMIADGYCMSVAYACLLDIVRSISLVVDGNDAAENNAFSVQLVNSSWCGLLAALTLLLEARWAFRNDQILWAGALYD